MKKLIFIMLLFGGLTIFSGTIEKALTATISSKPTTATINVTDHKQASNPNQKANIQNSLITAADIDIKQPTEEQQSQATPKFKLDNVNGIALTDDIKTVTDKLGQPLSVEKDPDLVELEVYIYPKMNIGFSDGIVSYVEVLALEGAASIDGVSVPITKLGLMEALGEPDYVAEDGIVFQRKSSLVKLFTDMETEEVTAIHYYHRSGV